MRKKRRQIDMPASYVIEHLDEAIEKNGAVSIISPS